MPPKKRFISCEICGNRASRDNLEQRMFMAKFPMDEDRCRQWVKVVGKEDLLHVPIEKLHTLKYVCGDHFEIKDFNKKKSRLKNSAIPSKNLKADPLPDEMLFNFPSHVYSNIDAAINIVSPVIYNTEATKVKVIAGPSMSNSESNMLDQQRSSQGLSDKKISQSHKRKRTHSCSEPSTSKQPHLLESHKSKKISGSFMFSRFVLRYSQHQMYCSKQGTHKYLNTTLPENADVFLHLPDDFEFSDDDFEAQVKPILHERHISQQAVTMMLTKCDNLLWICNDHKDRLLHILPVRLSHLLIRNECHRINLSFETSEEATADIMKKAHQQGISKS